MTDKPQTKVYRTVVPYVPESLDTVRWLTRESIENAITADNLMLVTYDEYDVDPTELPAKGVEVATAAVAEEFGVDPAAVRWRAFVAEAKLRPETEALLRTL